MLRAIEAEKAPGSPAVEQMRRDRVALRAALAADLASPIPARRANQFAQAVRDEIDRGLLADLSTGTPLEYHPPMPSMLASRNRPRGPGFTRADSWRTARVMALAATVALVGGVAWLAMVRPGTSGGTLASGTTQSPRELPGWAILPDKLPELPTTTNADVALANTPTLAADAAAEPSVTRDPATALAWAKRGVLAIRIVTDSPKRDRERLLAISQRQPRAARWALSATAPAGLAVIPTHPWPIDTRLADSNYASAPKQPETASIAAFGLTVRPTVEVLDAACNDLERIIAGAVVFERVDGLAEFTEGPQAEPTPDTAMDIIWWKKPASQWSPRLRVPVLVEFGRPEREPSKPVPAK